MSASIFKLFCPVPSAHIINRISILPEDDFDIRTGLGLIKQLDGGELISDRWIASSGRDTHFLARIELVQQSFLLPYRLDSCEKCIRWQKDDNTIWNQVDHTGDESP